MQMSMSVRKRKDHLNILYMNSHKQTETVIFMALPGEKVAAFIVKCVILPTIISCERAANTTEEGH